jgi:hypothetical protein
MHRHRPFLRGLLFRSPPELASDDQNILERLGQCLIWWASSHTGAGRRQIEAARPNPSRPRKYGTGLELATSRGWLELHESGTFVKLTQSGADLFA